MKLLQSSARSVNLAKTFSIEDGRCEPQFIFDAYHFHIETTFDTTNFVKLSKHTKKDIYSLKLVVTL